MEPPLRRHKEVLPEDGPQWAVVAGGRKRVIVLDAVLHAEVLRLEFKKELSVIFKVHSSSTTAAAVAYHVVLGHLLTLGDRL